ncbi:MAG: hypothetical protein NVS3B3_04310 [Aquirhabdus sp.]
MLVIVGVFTILVTGFVVEVFEVVALALVIGVTVVLFVIGRVVTVIVVASVLVTTGCATVDVVVVIFCTLVAGRSMF